MAPSFGVQLISCGPNRLVVLSRVRQLLRLSLVDVKNIVDAGPVMLGECLSDEKCQRLLNEFKDLGAEVDLTIFDTSHEHERLHSTLRRLCADFGATEVQKALAEVIEEMPEST